MTAPTTRCSSTSRLAPQVGWLGSRAARSRNPAICRKPGSFDPSHPVRQRKALRLRRRRSSAAGRNRRRAARAGEALCRRPRHRFDGDVPLRHRRGRRDWAVRRDQKSRGPVPSAPVQVRVVRPAANSSRDADEERQRPAIRPQRLLPHRRKLRNEEGIADGHRSAGARTVPAILDGSAATSLDEGELRGRKPALPADRRA